jgi:Arc/MetJ-type ribon-helix-helix transcriptional regulator
MTIHLPEHLEQYVHDQVLAGHFRSEDDVILDALERHRQAQQPPAAPANRHDGPSSLEMQRRLFAAGLISEIKPPITDLTPYQNRQAIPKFLFRRSKGVRRADRRAEFDPSARS